MTQRDMGRLDELKYNQFQSLNNLKDENGNSLNFDDIPCN